jgi:hypothetical protein
MMAAPLIAGNDIRSMSDITKGILTNREAIAINQDSLGSAGRRVRTDGNQELWVKELMNGAKAVCLFNRDTVSAVMSFSAAEIGMPTGSAVRDIWAAQDKGALGTACTATVAGHGVALLKIGQASHNRMRSKLSASRAGIVIENYAGSARIRVSGLAAGREAFLQICDLRGNIVCLERVAVTGGGTCVLSAADRQNRPLAGGAYFLRIFSGGGENSRMITFLR